MFHICFCWITSTNFRPTTAKSKKQRRVAAKALRKQQMTNPEALAPKIPLHEQTIDLPAGDGSLQGAIEAMEARDALTKSMRKNRRAKIKEANFLKAMG
jgi:large subunit ribosomal protein L54